MRLTVLILGIFFSITFDRLSAVGVDVDFSVDKKKWIDPNDPLSYRDGSVLTKPRSTLECDEHCDHLIRVHLLLLLFGYLKFLQTKCAGFSLSLLFFIFLSSIFYEI